MEPEDLIAIMKKVPRGTPWEMLRYAYLAKALRDNGGRVSKAAEDIKMSHRNANYLLVKMRELGFETPEYYKS